jgi:fructose-1,6-bisphosphatase I
MSDTASAPYRVQENLSVFETHLRGRAPAVPEALIEVLSAIALAGKSIAQKVRRARIEDIVGEVGNTNVQGEAQQKLDVISNELLKHTLAQCAHVAVIASEEEDEALVMRPASQGGAYTVLFDPLDGSSNIDVAVGIGTIFSVLPNDAPDDATARSALQPGDAQVAAGYVLYGSQVALVLTTGDGVDMYVLDPALGDFVLVSERLILPDEKKIYSINEAYVDHFPAEYRAYLEHAHGDGYTGRYIGSMVADVHRTLIKGGLFAYPTLTSHPEGKLRLLYEANPMAFVVEQAGGLASRGGARLLETKPTAVHQRTPVILGSRREVEKLESFL